MVSTGLGLALVKEWIEAMGGTVAVTSVLGKGSCFSMHLPIIQR
jgi:signal transduction histidine kinase